MAAVRVTWLELEVPRQAGPQLVKRSASLSAAATVAVGHLRVLQRQASVEAVTTVEADSHVSILVQRQASLDATTQVDGFGRKLETYERQAALTAIASVSASPFLVRQRWPVDSESDWGPGVDVRWDADTDDDWAPDGDSRWVLTPA